MLPSSSLRMGFALIVEGYLSANLEVLKEMDRDIQKMKPFISSRERGIASTIRWMIEHWNKTKALRRPVILSKRSEWNIDVNPNVIGF